jgi:hypothetical protein
MTNILFIAHAPSPNTARLRDAATGRIKDETNVRLDARSPFDCEADDARSADGIIIGTIENIGAMAGATKDFFDRSYNDLLDVTAGKPVAVYIRAGLDGTGTKRGIESILTGLRWRLVAPPLILKGDWNDQFPDQAAELALTLAAGVEMKLF